MKKLLFIILVFLIGCATMPIMPWDTVSNVPELVSSGIYRGCHPNFDELQKVSISTIISLEDDFDIVRAEQAEAKNRGLTFINFPMSETCAPAPELLRTIASEIEKYKIRHVYVHCRRGIDRTGYVIAAYRIINEGWSFDQAYKELVDHGHSSFYFATWIKSLKALEGN
jgi:protein-tyrosine phosphatase